MRAEHGSAAAASRTQFRNSMYSQTSFMMKLFLSVPLLLCCSGCFTGIDVLPQKSRERGQRVFCAVNRLRQFEPYGKSMLCYWSAASCRAQQRRREAVVSASTASTPTANMLFRVSARWVEYRSCESSGVWNVQ